MLAIPGHEIAATMASTVTTTNVLGSATSATRPSSATNSTSKCTSVVAIPTRRQALTMVLGTGLAGWWRMEPAKAENIPLFGIRKKLEKVEEEVEKEIEAAEREIKMAEEDLQLVVEGGGRTAGLWQAGAVVGAEVVGVVIATSVVNGILGPES